MLRMLKFGVSVHCGSAKEVINVSGRHCDKSFVFADRPISDADPHQIRKFGA